VWRADQSRALRAFDHFLGERRSRPFRLLRAAVHCCCRSSLTATFVTTAVATVTDLAATSPGDKSVAVICSSRHFDIAADAAESFVGGSALIA
jgi:hypothetical protein